MVFKILQEHLDEYLDKRMTKVRKGIVNGKDSNGMNWADKTEDKEVIHDEWMIHFADMPKSMSIASNGFKYGNSYDSAPKDVTYKKEKVNGGFNYAYLASDVIYFWNDESRFAIEQFKDYLMNERGDSFVMFKGNGYRFFHIGDNEEQVVFNSIRPETKVLILRIGEDYCVMRSIHSKHVQRPANKQYLKGESGLDVQKHPDWANPKNSYSDILYFSREITKVIQWVMNNYEQYRKNLQYNKPCNEEYMTLTEGEQKDPITLLHDFCNTDTTKYDETIRNSNNCHAYIVNDNEGNSFVQLSLRNFVGLIDKNGELLGGRWFQDMGCEFDQYHNIHGIWVEIPKTGEVYVLNSQGKLYSMSDYDNSPDTPLKEIENDNSEDRLITVDDEYYSTPDVAYDPTTGDEYSHSDNDAYPFVYLQKENELYVGRHSTVHASILKYDSNDANQIHGRIWTADNLVSFWQDKDFDIMALCTKLCEYFKIPSVDDIKIAYLSTFGSVKAFINNHPEFSHKDIEKKERVQALHLKSAEEKRQDANMKGYLDSRYQSVGKKLRQSNGKEMPQAEYNFYRRYGMGEGKLRNLIRSTIVETIQERFEVLKDDKIEGFIHSLYKRCANEIERCINLHLPKKKIIINDTYSRGRYDDTAIEIIVDMTLPQNGTICNGHWNWLDDSIQLTFNAGGAYNLEYFRNSILHEFTHKCDMNHFPTNWSGYYSPEYDANAVGKGNPINDIIYRLWTLTERNAYTTIAYSYDTKRLNSYIQRLQNEIKNIELQPDKYANPHVWTVYVGKYLFGKNYSEKDWEIVVDKFVSKSRQLLRKFKEKAMQRHGQAKYDEKQRHSDGFDDKEYDFKGPNAEAMKELTDSFSFMVDMIQLFKTDTGKEEWIASKRKKFPVISEKTLEYIWNKNIAKEIAAYQKNPKQWQDHIEWAKRHGYMK